MKPMLFLALTLVLFIAAAQDDENTNEESFDSSYEGFDFLINICLLNSNHQLNSTCD